MTEAELSVVCIIPTWQEGAHIAATIEAVRREPFSEIVVVDAGSPDGTAALAQKAADDDPRVRIVLSDRGRGTQMAAGLAASQPADVALFLHADTQLPPDAVARIQAALADPATVAGCFQLAFDQPGLLLGLSAAVTRWDTAWTTFGDQAFFMRTRALMEAGGIPETPFMEDVILRQKLRRMGRFVKQPERVITSARRFDRHGVMRTQALNTLLLMGYQLGVPIPILARAYGIRAARKPGTSRSGQTARLQGETLRNS